MYYRLHIYFSAKVYASGFVNAYMVYTCGCENKVAIVEQVAEETLKWTSQLPSRVLLNVGHIVLYMIYGMRGVVESLIQHETKLSGVLKTNLSSTIPS